MSHRHRRNSPAQAALPTQLEAPLTVDEACRVFHPPPRSRWDGPALCFPGSYPPRQPCLHHTAARPSWTPRRTRSWRGYCHRRCYSGPAAGGWPGPGAALTGHCGGQKPGGRMKHDPREQPGSQLTALIHEWAHGVFSIQSTLVCYFFKWSQKHYMLNWRKSGKSRKINTGKLKLPHNPNIGGNAINILIYFLPIYFFWVSLSHVFVFIICKMLLSLTCDSLYCFFLLHTSEQFPTCFRNSRVENRVHGIPFWGCTITYFASLEKFNLFVTFCCYKVTSW